MTCLLADASVLPAHLHTCVTTRPPPGIHKLLRREHTNCAAGNSASSHVEGHWWHGNDIDEMEETTMLKLTFRYVRYATVLLSTVSFAVN